MLIGQGMMPGQKKHGPISINTNTRSAANLKQIGDQ